MISDSCAFLYFILWAESLCFPSVCVSSGAHAMLDGMSDDRKTAADRRRQARIDDACERARRQLEYGKADADAVEKVVDTIRELGLTGARPAMIVACKPRSVTLPTALRVLSETGSMTAARAVATMGCYPGGPASLADEQRMRIFRTFVKEPMERGADMTRLLPMSGWGFSHRRYDEELSLKTTLRHRGEEVYTGRIPLRGAYMGVLSCDDPIATLERIGLDRAVSMCALRYYSGRSDYWSWAGSGPVMRMLAGSGDDFDARMDAVLDLLDSGDGGWDVRDVVVPVDETMHAIAEGLPVSFIMEDLRTGPSRAGFAIRVTGTERRISELIAGSARWVLGLAGFRHGLSDVFISFQPGRESLLDEAFYGKPDVRNLTAESIGEGNRFLDLVDAVPADMWPLMCHSSQMGDSFGFALIDPDDDAKETCLRQDRGWAEQVLSAGMDAVYRWMVWTHVQNTILETTYRHSRVVACEGKRYVLTGIIPHGRSDVSCDDPKFIAGMVESVPRSWASFKRVMRNTGSDDPMMMLTQMMEEQAEK